MSLDRMTEIAVAAFAEYAGSQHAKDLIGEMLCALWDPWLDDEFEQEIVAIEDDEPFGTCFTCDVGAMVRILDNSIGRDAHKGLLSRVNYDDLRLGVHKLIPKFEDWKKALEVSYHRNSFIEVMEILPKREAFSRGNTPSMFNRMMEQYEEAKTVFEVIDVTVKCFGLGVLGHLILRPDELRGLDVEMLEFVLYKLGEAECREKFREYESQILRLSRLYGEGEAKLREEERLEVQRRVEEREKRAEKQRQAKARREAVEGE